MSSLIEGRLLERADADISRHDHAGPDADVAADGVGRSQAKRAVRNERDGAEMKSISLGEAPGDGNKVIALFRSSPSQHSVRRQSMGVGRCEVSNLVSYLERLLLRPSILASLATPNPEFQNRGSRLVSMRDQRRSRGHGARPEVSALDRSAQTRRQAPAASPAILAPSSQAACERDAVQAAQAQIGSARRRSGGRAPGDIVPGLV